jgi:hypothetical protein
MQGGRKYNLGGQLTATAAKTRACTIGNATVLPHTYFLQLSAISATPADSVNEYTLKRISAIGSLAVTSTTPAPLASAGPASLLVGGAALTGINGTGEPTYTSNSDVLSFSHNQHAVYAFYAPEGGEFEQEASVTKGLGLFFVAGATAYSDVLSWQWVE